MFESVVLRPSFVDCIDFGGMAVSNQMLVFQHGTEFSLERDLVKCHGERQTLRNQF